jgi:transcriptional regulator with XRE-family HTH domain
MSKSDKDDLFAKRFTSLVELKGWSVLTRVQLAKKLGVSSTCAHFYLNGERLPSVDQARRLAGLFGVCVEWFLTGKGIMYPIVSLVNNDDYINVSKLNDNQRKILAIIMETMVKDEKSKNNFSLNRIRAYQKKKVLKRTGSGRK